MTNMHPGVVWHAFDYGDKKHTAPPHGNLVWVYGLMPWGEFDVTLGFFEGFTFCLWTGTDDCSIRCWAPLHYPELPERAARDIEDEEEEEEEEDE